LNPINEYSPDDWLTLITFADGTTKRYGASPHVDESQVLGMVMSIIQPRERVDQIVDVKTMRRHEALATNFGRIRA
tara:strand:+ start:206 stop:433 length:228 start_codon:yes stop_codon:yes gene_type:complete